MKPGHLHVTRRFSATVVILAFVSILALVSHAEEKGPTKTEAVRILRSLLTALEQLDYLKAFSFFRLPLNATPENIDTEMAQLLERKEISARGIEMLEAQGKWGTLEETVTRERAERFAAKFGVPAAQCFGLTLGNAEAGFHWDGRRLKLIRCDDIGKLKAE
jgi:hypothetical protein